MLNAFNKNISAQIAAAYCQSDEICREAVKTRLNLLFDDATFNNFLSTLNSKVYHTGNFYNLGYKPGGMVDIDFKYMDVIKGTTGHAVKRVPAALFAPPQDAQKFNALLSLFVPGLQFVKKYEDGTILFINPDFGYDIAYTGTPVVGGGGSGSGGGRNPNDEKQKPGTIYNPSSGEEFKTQVPPSSSSVSIGGFDLTSLLIPGAIVLGYYFFVKK